MTPLRYHRQHVARITQQTLADAIGVDKSTISRIETGGTSGRCRTSPEVAEAIEVYFKGALTRDQILFPHQYNPDGKPIQKRKVPTRANRGSHVS